MLAIVKQVSTVMIATDRNTAATETDSSYSPDGATVTPHLIHGFTSPRESAAQTASRSVFAGLARSRDKQREGTDRPCTLRTSAATVHTALLVYC